MNSFSLQKKLLALAFAVGLAGLLLLVLFSPPLKQTHRDILLNWPKTPGQIISKLQVIQEYRQDNQIFILYSFIYLYVFMQTFAIPGAVFLSIMSGPLFGPYFGLFLSQACSAVGSSVCYCLSYTIGSQLVNNTFSTLLDKLKKPVTSQQATKQLKESVLVHALSQVDSLDSQLVCKFRSLPCGNSVELLLFGDSAGSDAEQHPAGADGPYTARAEFDRVPLGQFFDIALPRIPKPYSNVFHKEVRRQARLNYQFNFFINTPFFHRHRCSSSPRRNTPSPSMQSSLNWPSKRSPFVRYSLPDPCIMSSSNMPSQRKQYSLILLKFMGYNGFGSHLLFQKNNTPRPQNLSFTHIPSQASQPPDLLSQPTPCILLSTHCPLQTDPSLKVNLPCPFLKPFFFQPWQEVPFANYQLTYQDQLNQLAQDQMIQSCLVQKIVFQSSLEARGGACWFADDWLCSHFYYTYLPLKLDASCYFNQEAGWDESTVGGRAFDWKVGEKAQTALVLKVELVQKGGLVVRAGVGGLRELKVVYILGISLEIQRSSRGLQKMEPQASAFGLYFQIVLLQATLWDFTLLTYRLEGPSLISFGLCYPSRLLFNSFVMRL